MRHLAKAGFSQSYTYFTWRNTAPELTEYFTELDPDRRARVPASEPVRQHAGHPARVPAARRPAGVHRAARPRGHARGELRHLQRLRAAENVPVRPGSEEYLDSEKYQIKVRDFARAGQPVRADRPDQPDPARAPGAAARLGPAVPSHRQSPAALLQQAFGGRTRSAADGREPRSVPHAARLRRAAAGGLGAAAHDDARMHVTRPACPTSAITGAEPQLRAARPGGPRGAHPAWSQLEAGGAASPRPSGLRAAAGRACPKRRILSGTRTPSSTRCTSARFSTAPTTASATSPGSPRSWSTSKASA